MLRRLLTFRWIMTSLLVLAAVAGMARLGFWQLDRHEQRAVENARVRAQITAPALDLNQPLSPEELPDMEYRQVRARGVFDPAAEIVLRNQVYQDQPGYHVLTPLRLEGSPYSLLVDRGFIPLSEGSPEARARYAPPAGPVEVTGILRRAQNNRIFGVPDPTLAPGQARLDAWNAVNLIRIQDQSAGPLLPVYMQLAQDTQLPAPPHPNPEEPRVDPGSHLGYAVQWFSFAAVLAFGYPFFVRKNLLDKTNDKISREGHDEGVPTS